MTAHPSRHDRLAPAFSLVELLVVMAIIVIMVAMSVNTVAVDKGREAVSSAIEEIKGIMNLARMEARGKSTYTWVCFQQLSGTQGKGVAVAVYAAKDGTTNAAATNLVAITPYKVLKNIQLAESSFSTPDRLVSSYGQTDVDPGTIRRLGGSTLTIAPQAGRSFTDDILRFNSRGVPSIPGVASTSFVEVLVYPTYGGAAQAEKASSILIPNSTGITKLFW